jgi:hypothetical protein
MWHCTYQAIRNAIVVKGLVKLNNSFKFTDWWKNNGHNTMRRFHTKSIQVNTGLKKWREKSGQFIPHYLCMADLSGLKWRAQKNIVYNIQLNIFCHQYLSNEIIIFMKVQVENLELSLSQSYSFAIYQNED